MCSLLNMNEAYLSRSASGLLHQMVQIVRELPPAWTFYWASNECLKDKGSMLLIFLLHLSYLIKSLVPRYLSRRSKRRMDGPQASHFTGLYD
jgi:hypothetical protein